MRKVNGKGERQDGRRRERGRERERLGQGKVECMEVGWEDSLVF